MTQHILDSFPIDIALFITTGYEALLAEIEKDIKLGITEKAEAYQTNLLNSNGTKNTNFWKMSAPVYVPTFEVEKSTFSSQPDTFLKLAARLGSPSELIENYRKELIHNQQRYLFKLKRHLLDKLLESLPDELKQDPKINFIIYLVLIDCDSSESHYPPTRSELYEKHKKIHHFIKELKNDEEWLHANLEIRSQLLKLSTVMLCSIEHELENCENTLTEVTINILLDILCIIGAAFSVAALTLFLIYGGVPTFVFIGSLLGAFAVIKILFDVARDLYHRRAPRWGDILFLLIAALFAITLTPPFGFIIDVNPIVLMTWVKITNIITTALKSVSACATTFLCMKLFFEKLNPKSETEIESEKKPKDKVEIKLPTPSGFYRSETMVVNNFRKSYLQHIVDYKISFIYRIWLLQFIEIKNIEKHIEDVKTYGVIERNLKNLETILNSLIADITTLLEGQSLPEKFTKEMGNLKSLAKKELESITLPTHDDSVTLSAVAPLPSLSLFTYIF